MKHYRKTILAFCAAALSICASAGDFQMKTELCTPKNIVKKGNAIQFRLQVKCPENYQFRAWRIFAYEPNVPVKFGEKNGYKLNKAKNPVWNSITILPWQWLSIGQRKENKTEFIFSIPSKKWDAGDYRISCTALFQKKDKNDKLPDKYLAETLTFTIEP